MASPDCCDCVCVGGGEGGWVCGCVRVGVCVCDWCGLGWGVTGGIKKGACASVATASQDRLNLGQTTADLGLHKTSTDHPTDQPSDQGPGSP